MGGDDIDANLVEYCLKDFTAKTQILIDKNYGNNAIRRLTTECEKRKRQLCAANSVVISLDKFYEGNDLKCELTRDKFEELNDDIFLKSIDLVKQVLVDAKLDHSNIDDVVLVGGTTRIPKIQDMLSDLFYGKPLNHSVNPDEAVAAGAAIQAAILNGKMAQAGGLLSVSDDIFELKSIVETRSDEEINNCSEYCKDFMSRLSDFMKKDDFKMKHKEFKAKAIESLKSKLIIRDEEFMNKQMAKLDDKIE